MRFFLDENIPRNVQLFFIRSGYEVYDVRGTYDEGLSDNEIFLIAQKKHAIFVTTDKDFFHTIPYLFQEHNGIIVISLSQPNADSILAKLSWAVEFVKKHPIANMCLLLTDDKIYYTKKQCRS